MICIEEMRHRNGEIGQLSSGQNILSPPRDVPSIETADTSGGYTLLGQEVATDHTKGAKLCEATVVIQRNSDQSGVTIIDTAVG